MTTQKVTQTGAEVLYRVDPGARTTQSGVEYLHRVGTPMSATQVGAEYLHRVTPVFAVTQAGVEYLYKHVSCTTRLCQIWTITRTDGEVFRFTSLDRDLTYFGEVYQACDSLVPSASEAVSSVDQAGNMDLSGAIGPDGITLKALFAGLFDGAEAEAWMVNWQGAGVRRLLLKGTFGAVEQSETGFKVELLGDGAKLKQTPLIRLLQPDCRWSFGDNHCQKDLTALTVTGTVDSGAGQRAFTDAARTETAGYFTRGKVTFTTGLNAGVSAEIKEHEAGGVFTVWPRFQFRIAAGDQYSMEPGCTNLKEASGGTNGCTAWGNLRRFGGFRNVPGQDRRNTGASVKPPGTG